LRIATAANHSAPPVNAGIGWGGYPCYPLNMSTAQDKRDFSKLSVHERLMLIGDIWDSIVRDGSPVPLTPSQLKELERRAKDAKANPADGVSAEEVDRMVARYLAEKRRA
jgi:putative addiction module component (TIGR02574 family)